MQLNKQVMELQYLPGDLSRNYHRLSESSIEQWMWVTFTETSQAGNSFSRLNLLSNADCLSYILRYFSSLVLI